VRNACHQQLECFDKIRHADTVQAPWPVCQK
jgi:hypothetical protein